MNKQRLESRLADLQEETLPELPELVHLRMEETYRIISGKDEVGLEAASEHQETLRRKRLPRWLSRVIIIAASVAGGLVLLISLGFISPAMAETLKQLPFISSVFQLAGDSGLRKANEAGLTANVEQTVTQDGMTLTVSEQMYDGSRLSLVLTRSKGVYAHKSFSDTWAIPDPETGSLINHPMDFYVNGELVNTGVGIAPGGREAPDSVIITTLNSGNLQLPDTFDFKMSVYLPGYADPFIFKFPVTRQVLEGVVLTPDILKMHDHINLMIKRLEVSTTSTQLNVEVQGEAGEHITAIEANIPDKYKVNGHFPVYFELSDEQGREVRGLGGEGGTGEGNFLSYTFNYEPFETMPARITIKPTIWKDGQKLYIPELAITVPVK
ncbi:DUF4179 domain-containing protein [Paenibacillus sp. FSL H8-0048]|uniref:DUF4179 domain-containing protein n=1 Tax=Paenibacillus sp. FSL H8-0048 TaxID=2954508 RepID=UPI0030F94ADA